MSKKLNNFHTFPLFYYLCTVRSLSFILALFFAFLLTAPCSDVVAAPGDNHTVEQNQKKTETQKHSDNCTPFCTCTCCGAQFSTTTVAVLPVNIGITKYSQKVVSYTSSFLQGALSGIWQPPKIG